MHRVCGWRCFRCAHCFEIWCILRCETCWGFRQCACLAPAGSWKGLEGVFQCGPASQDSQTGHAFHWLRPLWTSAVNRSRGPRSPHLWDAEGHPLSWIAGSLLFSPFMCLPLPVENADICCPWRQPRRLPASAGNFWKSKPSPPPFSASPSPTLSLKPHVSLTLLASANPSVFKTLSSLASASTYHMRFPLALIVCCLVR